MTKSQLIERIAHKQSLLAVRPSLFRFLGPSEGSGFLCPRDLASCRRLGLHRPEGRRGETASGTGHLICEPGIAACGTSRLHTAGTVFVAIAPVCARL